MRNRLLVRATRRDADFESPVQGAPAAEDSTADHAASDRARSRYRCASMATIDPDAAIVPLLCSGERVHSRRLGVKFELREALDGATVNRCGAGDLYLTSRRLMVLSPPMLGVELEWIQEIGLAGDRLLLTLADGSGVCLVATRPRLLRVEISAARERVRQARIAKTCRARLSGESVEIAEPAGGLGPVSDAELVQDAADVTLHRPG
jgi:hypothetical protein